MQKIQILLHIWLRVIRSEYFRFDDQNGIKCNFDLIEVRNKNQNTRVMPEKNLRKLLCSKSGIKKLFWTHWTLPRQLNPEWKCTPRNEISAQIRWNKWSRVKTQILLHRKLNFTTHFRIKVWQWLIMQLY